MSVEYERDYVTRQYHLHMVRALVAERKAAEQALHAAREALTAVWAYTRTKEGGTHERLGEACGADACVLCLAEETAREALQVIDKALEGR